MMLATAERANAKLNLSLDIIGKRDDGFHDLFGIMQSIDLHDDISVGLTDDGKITVSVDVADVPSGEKNLAFKAAKCFFEASGLKVFGASINIKKRIPVFSGLGGGSSDAAAVLRALNFLCGMTLYPEELVRVAAKVGSDVPFCVNGGTAIAEGRGEVLTTLPPLPPLPALICVPAFRCSTPELFARADSSPPLRRPDNKALANAAMLGDLPRLFSHLYNVFEEVLPEQMAQAVREIKEVLSAEGALYSGLSGSGSAVFGLFPDLASADRASAAAKKICCETIITKLSV